MQSEQRKTHLSGYRFRQQFQVLGLPFDAVTTEQACERIVEAIDERQRCFISTANLNFVINAQKDTDFARSIKLSDLNLADGIPLIWAARFLNIPLPERVAGSTVFERLAEKASPEKPIRIFFFGGNEGVAEKACHNLNQQGSGLFCCGYYYPGIGSVESMSNENIIQQINAAKPDFLVVSLGAKKGQSWILHNLSQLDVPVVSHLGAVVNFVAGTVKRAPTFWQKAGLEWLWRIIEEPYLWRRYFNDGIAAIKLAVDLVKIKFRRQSFGKNEAGFSKYGSELTIVLSGQPTSADMDNLYRFLNEHLSDVQKVTLKLQSVDTEYAEIKAFLEVCSEVCRNNMIKCSEIK